MARHLLSLLTLLTLLAPLGAVAGERAAVEQHLMRAAPGALLLGRAPADASVDVVLGFAWRERAALDAFLRAVADPSSPEYQRFLSPDEFTRRFAPRPRTVAATARALRRAGLRIAAVSPSRTLLTMRGRADAVERALGVALVEVADGGRRHLMTASAPQLPAPLGAQVVAVGAATTLQPPPRAALRQTGSVPQAPFGPQAIAQLYGFSDLYAGGVRGDASRASTIAIATAHAYDPADLETFWRVHGVPRTLDSVELIRVAGKMSPAPQPGPDDALETTLDVQWASALAPHARVLVYAGTDTMSTTFLQVYDRIVADNRAAVLSTSWGRCEADYPRSFLAQLDAVFARAAAQGITVVAAAGDRGSHECGGDAPSVSSPASHPYVLAVGGTSLIADGDGLREAAWAGSGGATSAHWPAPAWQMHPAPRRVLSDVAINADPGSGYLVQFRGATWALGGTSVGAPIWAALVALANQARADAGRATLGLAAPQLCELAHAGDLAPAPFADIVAGDNGAFAAGPGWDFPTGWGTPDAAALATALAGWTPPAHANGGLSSTVTVPPARPDVTGAVRLRVQRRCAAAEVHLHTRGLAPGRYALVLDGEPVASFDTDRRGVAILDLPQLDLRGQTVQVLDEAGEVVFGADDGARTSEADEVEAAFIGTGMAAGASGTLRYRSGAGREELTVTASLLPPGAYEVRVGSETIGAFTARAGQEIEMHFDSLGVRGEALPMSPRCKPVLLVRGGMAYLRTTSDALAPGECGRDR